MMNNEKRAEVEREIFRMERAVYKTKSEHLRRDYGKAIKRLRRELAVYDRYKQGA